MTVSEPKSPCVSICVLDEDDICQGCYRSAEEITDWFMASDAQKKAVIERAKERLDASMPIRLK
ncbi:MAG: DUF1289 domain-containing protein [Halioglobus sp.]